MKRLRTYLAEHAYTHKLERAGLVYNNLRRRGWRDLGVLPGQRRRGLLLGLLLLLGRSRRSLRGVVAALVGDIRVDGGEGVSAGDGGNSSVVKRGGHLVGLTP